MRSQVYIVQLALQDNPAGQLAGDLLRDAGDAISTAPLGAQGVMVLVLIAGLILWFAGGKVVKPALLAVGVALGAAGGMILLPELGTTQVASIPSPYVGLAGGAIVGCGIAMMLFRMAITVSAVGAFAVGGLLAGACFLQFAPRLIPPEPPAPLASPEPAVDLDALTTGLDTSLDRAASIKRDLADHLDPKTRAMLHTAAGQTRQFFERLARQTRSLWDDLSPREQAVIVGGTLAGGVVGLLVGLVMPRKSAAIVTAMAGAALWLASATWLAHAARVPGRELLHRSPLAWAAIWLAVSALGVAVQLARLRPAPSEG